MSEYKEVLCNEKHRRMDEKLNLAEIRLNNHSTRIDKLEQFESSTRIEIRNLIEQIKSLVSVIKWGTTLVITTLLGFFLWYVQKL